MKRRLWIGALVMLCVWIFMGSVSAQLGGNLSVNDSDPVYITVNVSTKTMVDVEPYALTWSPVDPGGVGDNDTEILGPNYFAIQIENIGSHNITHVWFNATYPSASPFARGNAAYTDAGNYVVLSSNTSSNKPPANGFWFINRVEYNETRELVYLRDPDGNMPPDSSTYTYGRFRNASNEYFWMLNNVSPNCNASTYIRIGNESHTRTQTGTTNFQTGNFSEIALSSYGGWAVGHISSGPLSGYEVAVNATCAVFFSHWNRDFPFDSPGTEAVYAYSGILTPGDSFAMAIKVYVPYGIYEGQSGQGTIWAIVNDV